jgi:hypothetical protein
MEPPYFDKEVVYKDKKGRIHILSLKLSFTLPCKKCGEPGKFHSCSFNSLDVAPTGCRYGSSYMYSRMYSRNLCRDCAEKYAKKHKINFKEFEELL